MGHSLASADLARERQTLADVCGKPAKATLRPHVPASPLRLLASVAIENVTKKEAAAADADIHPSRLSHKLADGTLRLCELERMGPEVAAELGRQLVEAYGPLSASPAARLRQKAKETRALADELDQLADYIEEVA